MSYRRSPLMQERIDDNRERIMRATRELIANGGFRAVSVSAVAKSAGLSTGAIYRYFPSKSRLLVHALTDAVDYEIDLLRRLTQAQTTAAERLRVAVDSFTRRALRGPHLAYAFIAEPIDPDVDAGRIACRVRFGEVFKDVLTDGIAAGEFPAQSVDVSSACIVGAFTEALVGPVSAANQPANAEHVIDEIVAFCLRAAGAAPIGSSVDA